MNRDKILVEIATYCDPELLNTVNSAIKQADYPERVFFSICYQGDDIRDLRELEKIPNCKIKYLTDSETKGLCYARYLCQQMIEDEKYIYQIDSHMRFIKHWDSEMIKQLLSFNDQKAFISSYPYDLDSKMAALPVDDKIFDQPTPPTMNVPEKFDHDSFFVKFSSYFADPDQFNQPSTPFLAGGNFFTFAKAQKQVLNDPKMWWHGDELAMSIRYFTHGWTNYCAERSYVYHKYYRKNRAIHSGYTKGSELEKKRFKQLLDLDHQNHDMGEFGLGKERTLAQFEACTGINFAKKTIDTPTSRYSILK